MIPKKYRKELDRLIQRYQQGIATAEESRFIEDYYNSFEGREAVSTQLTEEEKEQWKQTLLTKIHERMMQGETAPVIPLYRKTWFRISAAACIILLLGLATYVILSGVEGRHKEQQAAQTHDVPAPTNTRAVITLADGRKVYLDSAGNGILAQEDNVNVVKSNNGEIVYQNANASTPLSMTYNTLYNPRGSKVISLTLSDGTKVWLNSESSLRYPASFASNAVSREVEITGEAYFEVTHIARPFKAGNEGEPYMPFIVKKGNTEVKVLGTHFNVNAYDDEESLKVTLLEGSVQVSATSAKNSAFSAVKIKPGQQAVVTLSGVEGRNSLLTTRSVDVDEVMSWKNGLFNLKEENIRSIMRQVSRWYDVDIEYQGDVSDIDFYGMVSRRQNVSELLRVMEKTGIVHFKIEGRKITVTK